MQLLRADRWPTILLCKVQVFQHFETLCPAGILRLLSPIATGSRSTALERSCKYPPRAADGTWCTQRYKRIVFVVGRSSAELLVELRPESRAVGTRHSELY